MNMATTNVTVPRMPGTTSRVQMMEVRRATVRRHALAACMSTGTSVWAGGHFDVDDAGTLDPGQCRYETWVTRIELAPANVIHFGPACRVGPIELGFNFDRISQPDGRQRTRGPQVKWTFFGNGDASLIAALGWSATYDLTGHGKPGQQVLVPLTWRPTQTLSIHANLGLDRSPIDGARTYRRGIAGEWAVDERVSLIVERNRAAGSWTSRAGLRFGLTPLVSLDISAARTIPLGIRSYVLGLNREFLR